MRKSIFRTAWIVLLIALISLSCNLPFTRTAKIVPTIQELERTLESLPEIELTLPPIPEIEVTLPSLLESSPVPTYAGSDSDLPLLLSNNELSDISVSAITEDNDTVGSILAMKVTNPGDEDLEVVVPCGYIFDSQDSEIQRLMVIQPLQFGLPAGNTETVEPFVACIDADRSAPDFQSVFLPGEMATGNLLVLAECLCQKELNEISMVTAQFAVWEVTTNAGLMDLMSEEGEPPVNPEMFSEFMSGMGFGDPGDILSSCGINIDEGE
jgi:hypothetical protein